MSYLALYRKYRPDSLNEVFGQKYIVNIIKNAVLNNKISHAYLFSGPRGTGKTTMAKLIAKIVNCSNLDGFEPCDVCDSCSLINSKSNPDILEIDAASNNGVDEIRAIRDKVSLMPSVSKYKVYIIDEVHMLSMSAFNALLKTLEEPPTHAIFILATTELYKVPETIVSRCQCYEFERISVDNIVSCLDRIVKKEKLNVSSDVLGLIAKHCNGGMRDSISLLDKLCSCSDVVDCKLFYDVVGMVDDDIIADIIGHIADYDVKYVFDYLEKLEKNGKNFVIILNQFIEYLKNFIVDGGSLYSSDVLLIMIDGFNSLSNNVKFSSNILLSFEVEVLKIVNKLKSVSDVKPIFGIQKEKIDIIPQGNDLIITDSEVSDDVSEVENNDEHNFDISVNFDVIINNAFALADKNLKNDVISKWRGFYDYVHNKEFSSVVSYFLDAEVQVVGKKDVIISASYDSVVNNAVKNIAKLELLFNLVMGKFYNIAFILSDDWEILKEKYISDVNSGKKYEYIDSEQKNDVIIENEENNSYSDVSLSAKDIFGSDIVQIK